MRTVHEPEITRGPGTEPAAPTTSKGKSSKSKHTNGGGKVAALAAAQDTGPMFDEDGNEVEPSPPNDNIAYIPAHHPITGQKGFMIHYPPDIHFSAWESSIAADQLMRLLRRQVHWAQRESDELKQEIEALEQQRREEWTLKEILLEGTLEAELAHADREQLLQRVDASVLEAMEHDVEPAKQLTWSGGTPTWRNRPPLVRECSGDVDVDTPEHPDVEGTPSPPPTGASGGFDGEGDPYDNYVANLAAQAEERERLRSMRNTPAKATQEQKESEAVGALLDMRGS